MFHKTEYGVLFNGDCLEKMKMIPSGSIDLILTDPPYGTTSCKWDIIIPFKDMWKELERVIKPNGAIVLFGSQPFTSLLIQSNLKLFKYSMVWIKTRGADFMMCKNKPLNRYEDILVFSKANFGTGSKSRMVYYPQDLIEINKKTYKKKY